MRDPCGGVCLSRESSFFQFHCGSLSAVNRRLAVQNCCHTLQSYATDQQSWQPLLRSEQSRCILLSTKVSRVTVGDAELLLRQACMSAPLISTSFSAECNAVGARLVSFRSHSAGCAPRSMQRGSCSKEYSTDVVK